jgi:predicted nucleic acid-binding protein
VARGKLKMPWDEIGEALNAIRVLCEPVVSLTVETHEVSIELAQRLGYQIYDASIIAAAMEAGCDVLYSEDMQDGKKIRGLTIRNPFGKR